MFFTTIKNKNVQLGPIFFIFAFISPILRDRSKKLLLQVMSKYVLPVFSSRKFTVSDLTFRSLIHFELIFVYDISEISLFYK